MMGDTLSEAFWRDEQRRTAEYRKVMEELILNPNWAAFCKANGIPEHAVEWDWDSPAMGVSALRDVACGD